MFYQFLYHLFFSLQAIRYRALAMDGSHTYARREIGVTACLLVACKTDDPTSCPYRYSLIILLHICSYMRKYLKCGEVQYALQQ